jgi:hypothetical protein
VISEGRRSDVVKRDSEAQRLTNRSPSRAEQQQEARGAGACGAAGRPERAGVRADDRIIKTLLLAAPAPTVKTRTWMPSDSWR